MGSPTRLKNQMDLTSCTIFPHHYDNVYWHIFGIKCPVLFDRASRKWWKPEFDSKILEKQFLETSSHQVKLRYRYALAYFLIVSFSWMLYFVISQYSNWIPCACLCLFSVIITFGLFLLTFSTYYRHHRDIVSILTVVIICALSLTSFANYHLGEHEKSDMTVTAIFSLCVEVILLIYTLIPISLHVSFICGSLYSFIYELLLWFLVPEGQTPFIIIRIFLHICTHVIGSHILIMTEARSRSTFLMVGQSLLVRRDLDYEKRLKEKTIHSVMPPKVANWLMCARNDEDEGGQESENLQFVGRRLPQEFRGRPCSPRPSTNNVLPVFRPFNMHRMENVSILYADIVGFTKMSSNKTAEQLVGLLNDLFGRFDNLCTVNRCEKIMTLGDCYYCVSGCPEPEPEHAKCCVEMGFGMIQAINKFDEDRNEQVDMRVGVHTGTVLCGIVGTRRFKFDVWSNDVTLANQMETTGKPGRIHISETTLSFLDDQYGVEEGKPIQDLKTYFITKRKSDSLISQKTWHSQPVVNKPVPNAEQMDGKNQENQPKMVSDNEDDEYTEASMMVNRFTKVKPAIQNLPGQTVASLSLTTINSRKDSGIRSDRSSLPDFADVNILRTDAATHRVSGYYTSSLPSIADASKDSLTGFPTKLTDAENPYSGGSFSIDPNLTLNESLARVANIRKQSDLQIIKCIQRGIEHEHGLVKSPISQWTLFFLDEEMEMQYRENTFCYDRPSSKPNVAPTAFYLYYDLFVCFIVFSVIAVSSFTLFNKSILWIIVFILAILLQVSITALCLQVKFPINNRTLNHYLTQAFIHICTRWNFWHVCGLILVLLPLLAVFTNFSCQKKLVDNEENAVFFCQLAFIGLIHLCNFTRLNWWMKIASSTIGGLTLLLLFGLDICPCEGVSFNERENLLNVNDTSDVIFPAEEKYSFFCNEKLFKELVISVILLLILVWFLNREFEISHRYSFHGNQLAIKDKTKVQAMKNQAEMLLHNIIPRHVAEQLKITSKYSENHKNVGVLFASITNFNDMYDESYEGGKEYLRVLNELVGDYDELLSKKEFRNVDKIKTIGSTFMAASGLNPAIRNENVHPMQHLFELMDFALAMQQVIDNFNSNLLEFNFTLRIGFNFGDVTAGVIGTTKLYYDIWGDAVNIASRMDSTGVVGEIQVSEFCVSTMEEVFKFKFREKIFVKGKNEMKVYLLCGRKDVNYHKKNEVTDVNNEALSDATMPHSNISIKVTEPRPSSEQQNWV